MRNEAEKCQNSGIRNGASSPILRLDGEDSASSSRSARCGCAVEDASRTQDQTGLGNCAVAVLTREGV